MSDERVVLGLLRRLLEESYVDFEFQGRPRFVVDGGIYDVTEAELDAFDRWWARDRLG